MSAAPFVSVDDLVARIGDGCRLALPSDRRGVAMAATRALIRRGVRDLHLVNVPTGGLQTDLLIAAGCVRAVETSGVSLAEFGPAPSFGRAVTGGTVDIRDATCPAIHAGLQAAEKGLPFMPLRGILGTDVLRHRADWRVVDNPFAASGDPIVLIAAVAPDVALFHAAKADRAGNVWVGRERDLITMAHAARTTLVTVECIEDTDFLADPALACGTLSNFYVEAVAQAERGSWPLALPGCYGDDEPHIVAYAQAARTPEGIEGYLAEFVHGARAAAQ